jgi:hypothetical protein
VRGLAGFSSWFVGMFTVPSHAVVEAANKRRCGLVWHSLQSGGEPSQADAKPKTVLKTWICRCLLDLAFVTALAATHTNVRTKTSGIRRDCVRIAVLACSLRGGDVVAQPFCTIAGPLEFRRNRIPLSWPDLFRPSTSCFATPKTWMPGHPVRRRASR